MRPFLSPARVVILSLIDMYCSDVVSEEDDDFVLQLINCYVTDSYVRPANQRQRFLSRWQRAFMNIGLLSNVHSLRPALQTCFTAHSPSDLPLCITLWDDLVARLWLRLCTLDHMVPFFDNLHTYIALTYAEQRVQRELGIGDPPGAPMQLERRSPLGLLVYQSYIEFSRLSFAGRCELWEDFVRYRDPTRTDFKILWPHDYPLDQVLFDGVLSEYQGEWGTQTETIARVAFDRMLKDESVSASSDETDKLVALLIDRARTGFRPSNALREATDRAITGATIVPAQVTFYRLIDAWRMGDVSTAYDQLHRYFDLVARQGIGAAFGYNVGPMNKSVIQRDFGEHSNDLLSMLDAVHAGREARDYNSLRFSLLWLYMYARVLPRYIRPHQLQGLAGQPTDGQQVLPYVRQDAESANFHSHHALASLLEARVALGDGRPPLAAKTCLRSASRKITAHCEVTLEGQLTSTSMLFWDRIGFAPLAVLYGRAFMRSRHDDVPFDDAVRVACRLALLYAQSGEYTKVKATVMRLNPEGLTSIKPQSSLRHVLTFVAATQAVRADQFAEADDLLMRRLPAGGFPSCAPAAADRKMQGPSQMDPDLAAQAALLRVASLARRADSCSGGSGDVDGGALVAARSALDAFEAAYDKGVGDLHVLLQIALARIDLYARAGRGLRVLTFLVRTVQACLRRRYHALLWDAVGAVARLLVAEGEFRAAHTLLATALPRSLETARVETTAALYQHLADACMGLAGQAHEAATASAATTAAATGARQRHRRRMKQHLSQAWWGLGQAQLYMRRAGCGAGADTDLALKRRVILVAAQQLDEMDMQRA